MKEIVVFLGPPGSGKGTQGERLHEELGFTNISTGNLIRAEVAKGSKIGQELKAIIDAGNLVDDDIVSRLLVKELDKCGDKIVLDGYPRSLIQATILNNYIRDTVGAVLKRVFVFKLSEEEIIDRIKNRVICGKCGFIYNLKSQKPKEEGVCDICQSKLQHRSDDVDLQAIIQRNNIFEENSKNIISFYEKKSLIFTIDCCKTINDVYNDIINILNNNEKR